jgi:Ser-tRNA(Ala) deacylase AlaX
VKVILQSEDYVVLNQTIFYPQGGGKPCDRGKIVGYDFEYTVHDVRQIEEGIRHYIEPKVNIALDYILR